MAKMNRSADSAPPPASAARDGEARPTLRTIADLTGYAVTTVSRALKGDERIALRTRDRIGAVARDVGYVPDRAAQRLRTGRTNVLALVLDPHSEILGFSESMIAGLSEGIAGTRYHLVLMQHALGEDPMRPIRDIVRNRLADGILLARTRPRDRRIAFLNAAGCPFVTHGRTDLGPHPWHDYDNAGFAAMAVRRLAAQGYGHVGLLAPSPQYTFHRHMCAGFAAGLDETGLRGTIPEGFDLNSDADRIARGVLDTLARPDPPDAWICPGEIAALAVASALADAGHVAGGDVGLVAKRTSPVFDHFRPQMDAIREDIVAAGRSMARLLLARIDGERPETLGELQAPAPCF